MYSYDKWYRLQRGRCAICKQEKELVEDQDTSNGQQRDLLCETCSAGIHCFDADPDLLRLAAKYVCSQINRLDQVYQDALEATDHPYTSADFFFDESTAMYWWRTYGQERWQGPYTPEVMSQILQARGVPLGILTECMHVTRCVVDPSRPYGFFEETK